jgi:hypothetical protein
MACAQLPDAGAVYRSVRYQQGQPAGAAVERGGGGPFPLPLYARPLSQ